VTANAKVAMVATVMIFNMVSSFLNDYKGQLLIR